MIKSIVCNMYSATTHKLVGQLEISVDKLSHYTFQVSDKIFLETLGISNQTSIIMASKVSIKKCNDVDILVNTSNDIYRLKTRSSNDNHYLVIPKDCTIYV